jgi:hypothetical protein
MNLPGFQGREQDDETNSWEQGKGHMVGPPPRLPAGIPAKARPLRLGLLLLVATLLALIIAAISWIAADGEGAGPANGGDRALAPRLPGDAAGVT